MILTKCHIENFGTLNNYKHNFSQGLNVILEENGWGKSTLSVFIKAMFYGLSATKSTSLDENERKKYMPWQGGKYGGYIEFILDDKEYRIERFFGNKKSEDSFRIFDLRNKKECSDYSDQIGFELFNIDAEAYERSTFLPQKKQTDNKPNINDSIKAKLTNLIESTDDINNYEGAHKLLDNQRAFYFKTGNRGKIAELEKELHDINMNVELCNKKVLENDNLIKERISEEERLIKCDEFIKKTQEQITKANENELKKEIYETYNEKKNEHKKICADINEINKKFNNQIIDEQTIKYIEEKVTKINIDCGQADIIKEQLKGYNNITANNKRSVFWLLIIIFASILFVTGAAICFINITVGMIFIGISVCLSIFGVVLKYSTNKKFDYNIVASELNISLEKLNKEITNNSDEVKKFLNPIYKDINTVNFSDKITELKNEKMILDNKIIERENKAVSLQKYIKERNIDINNIDYLKIDIDINKLKSDLDKYINAKNDIIQKIADKKADIANNEKIIKQEEDYISEKIRCEKELFKAKYNLNIILKTMEFLGKSRENISSNYLSKMEESCDKYIKQFNNLDEFSIDTDLEIKIEKNGEIKDINYFSTGYKDIIGLCSRLALIDAMFKNEKPFVILDDPFVYYDEKNFFRAKDILKQISAEYQIIYLICHASRA